MKVLPQRVDPRNGPRNGRLSLNHAEKSEGVARLRRFARGKVRHTPRISMHTYLEIGHAVHVGHQPGDPPPLQGSEPVPGCACYRCTGYPADDPVRAVHRRRDQHHDHLPVEEARAVPILDLCTRLGVTLRRVGKSYRGPCPIHRGEHLNFSVTPDAGFFHCFVCGAGGDAIELYSRITGLGFADAVREMTGR